MPGPDPDPIDRRTFLHRGAAAAIGTTALSYSRILGANDRIALGHIGIGNRGRELDWIASQLKDAHKVEMTAVCDLWSVNRDKAVEANRKYYGRAPRAASHPEELLASKDVDAVLISTPEHSHSPMLTLTVQAGKDAYCEKPMGNALDEIKAARDAVVSSKRVVQIGTQHRSEPYPKAAREIVRSGTLGEVSKIEVVWNYRGPRWRGRPEVQQIREQDTDWKAWLGHRGPRPFDPRLYFEFRLYKDFSSGIPDQWMSHGIDLVHWFMDDPVPASVVAHGGVFAWHDGRENPDTFQALLEYPKGFLVSYSTSFGNDSPSFTRYMGKQATLINVGGEGSPRYQVVDEAGVHEDDATVYEKRKVTEVRLPGQTGAPPTGIGDDDLSHMTNWFECLRSRQAPHATVQDGFNHSVACMMAAQSYRQGRRLYWNAKTETITDTPAAT